MNGKRAQKCLFRLRALDKTCKRRIWKPKKNGRQTRCCGWPWQSSNKDGEESNDKATGERRMGEVAHREEVDDEAAWITPETVHTALLNGEWKETRNKPHFAQI